MAAQKLRPKTQQSIDFLRRWTNGLWVLTAIVPDGRIETATFSPDRWALAAEWIEKRQGEFNLYFHVNPVRRELSAKASKEDVARLEWLHVDIDPRVGEIFEDERKRALRLLRTHDPKPTVIIDSGGGYQGFWRLTPDPRLEINGQLGKAQELEAYNIQLEKVFGADHCHNVDRIMRLPGTINLPTKKKVKKGREPAQAKLVEWNEVEYSIDRFVPAVRVQSGEPGLGASPVRALVAGNVPDIGTEELSAWAKENNKALSDHTLALIAGGEDPLDPTKYPSRSEALFRVCCDLVRAEVPDEMIFAVITGSNEISTSVRDKPDWQGYALRQIERAKEEAIDPWLRKLNEKHAVISDIGGRCRIISEVKDSALERTKISKQSFEDFRNRYRNRKVQIGVGDNGQPMYRALGAWWIDHPARRQFETIVFAPGREVEEAYNLWKGFACDAVPGNRHELFLAHILHNVCGGNRDHYNWLIGWLARTVQHPDGPGEVAVVLRGKRGTGKSFFAREFGKLWGRHYLQVSDSKHLVGSFNAHLRDTVVLFGDEAFFAGDKKHESVLKTLITEEHLVIEGKGVDAEAAPNYVHLILASNENWVVPAGLDERRFFVLEVGDEKKQDHEYFKQIKNELDNGGRENLLNFLLAYDIREFEVRRAPETEALREQKIMSMDPDTQWMLQKLLDGVLLKQDVDWREKVLADSLYDDYLNELQRQGRNYKLTRPGFGKFLSRLFPPDSFHKRQELAEVPWTNEHGFEVKVKKRAYVYHLPPLETARAWWDAHMGGPFPWSPVLPKQEDIEEDPPF